MLTRPNPSSGVPVYLQLMEQVRHGLQTGALRPGESLPGIRPLAEELVINPNTVARAYLELEHEGLVRLQDGARALLPWKGDLAQPSRGLVATQTGLALENSRLNAQVASEVAARIKRTRELEAAGQVQRTLLPQEYPPIAGLDYAGACRPALGVGGDYYDFIRLSDHTFGIAIGDVCGKGIPAALLMATLRAYLRSQATSATPPVDIMATLNRHLHESFAANRFATFFYAVYDSSTRMLTYSNAGHNPPFIFRKRGSDPEILRLNPCGPVLGFMLESSYAEQSVILEPGDLVVGFTDGISEAMNDADEEWGEEGLMELIRVNRKLSARELIDQIMGEADVFTAGRSQYDDMTLITVRVTH